MASLARQQALRVQKVWVDGPASRVSLWQRILYQKKQELGGQADDDGEV